MKRLLLIVLAALLLWSCKKVLSSSDAARTHAEAWSDMTLGSAANVVIHVGCSPDGKCLTTFLHKYCMDMAGGCTEHGPNSTMVTCEAHCGRPKAGCSEGKLACGWAQPCDLQALHWIVHAP